MLSNYIQKIIQQFEVIPEQRKQALEQLTTYIQQCLASNHPVNLTFICTHNSRRSHLGQIWAATAAAHYGIAQVSCYSGGTEVTAFNPRAVAAVERAGFTVKKDLTNPTNPVYTIAISGGGTISCYSKKYDDASNPAKNFAAVMTCSQADEACPIIPGAATRISLPYNDPKEADGTPEEANRYDERCAQIGREMMYAFSMVKQ